MAKDKTKTSPKKADKQAKDKTKDRNPTAEQVAATSAQAQTNVGKNFDLTKLTSDQIAQLELDEAIKNSSNAAANLEELKSPLTFRGCVLNLLILTLLTIIVALVISYFWVDKFHLGTVIVDMLTKFGIVAFWESIRDTVAGWFKPDSAPEAIRIFLTLLG